MSSINTALHLLKTPGKMIIPLAERGFFNWLPDESYLKLVYHGEMGKKLNLKNPQTFNEKLQWLKLYDRKPLYHQMVDKYEVKQYVADKIGSEYIIPTLGVWDSVDNIAFDQLPEKFVLKCTHDSGSVVICKDKRSFNSGAAKKKLASRMKKSTYWFGREWPYKGLKPRIIAEPYLEDRSSKELEIDGNLTDYKVHCFQGEPKTILVCKSRYSEEGLTEDFVDTNWRHLEVKRPLHGNAKNKIARPDELEKMLELSRKLSGECPFLRVDFYIVNHQLFFGETTFYPASGLTPFEPASFDLEMGSWLQLPKK